MSVALLGAGLAVAGPASSQNQGAATLSLSPTSGPIGTEITATITGCVGANLDGTARLDFAFTDTTPANTVMFVPDADGTATVTIEALDKEGTEGKTAGEVNLSQCTNNASASAPFTVVRTTTTTLGATTTTTAGGGGGGGTTTTTQPETTTQPASAATPSTATGRIALTG